MSVGHRRADYVYNFALNIIIPTSWLFLSDEPTKKPVRAHETAVVDSRGRQRFHGAFTGGFSAGYFNSVGTKEGTDIIILCKVFSHYFSILEQQKI